jgi:hypothetical protein
MHRRPITSCLVALLCQLVLSGQRVAAEPPAIVLTNYQSNDEIRYPVPLIRGTLADSAATEITLINTSSSRDTRQMKGLAYKGRFKVMTELLPGENKLLLRSGKNEIPLTLRYKPQTTSYFVRAIYLTDNTGETAYETPLDKDPQDYAAKLDTALKLMQTFTAERMNDLGFGRTTFNLELDANGKVVVHLHKGALPAADYYAMKDLAWYDKIYRELDKPFPTKFAKNFAVAAYSRFDPATGKTRAHTALGGGGLGLFGSGNLYTWPTHLADAQPAFMDARRIDKKRTQDDSAFRNTFWGAASTTIGASLHETGHTFGLPHSKEPQDIMTRGFDHFNRAFTFVDPPSAHSKTPVEFTDDQIGCFAPISAASLVTSRWFHPDQRAWRDGTKISISKDKATGDIVIKGDADIRYVSWSVKGDAVDYRVPPPGSRKFTLTTADIEKKAGSAPYRLRVVDAEGNSRSKASEELTKP